jgi:hypothetical protein
MKRYRCTCMRLMTDAWTRCVATPWHFHNILCLQPCTACAAACVYVQCNSARSPRCQPGSVLFQHHNTTLSIYSGNTNLEQSSAAARLWHSTQTHSLANPRRAVLAVQAVRPARPRQCCCCVFTRVSPGSHFTLSERPLQPDLARILNARLTGGCPDRRLAAAAIGLWPPRHSQLRKFTQHARRLLGGSQACCCSSIGAGTSQLSRLFAFCRRGACSPGDASSESAGMSTVNLGRRPRVSCLRAAAAGRPCFRRWLPPPVCADSLWFAAPAACV